MAAPAYTPGTGAASAFNAMTGRTGNAGTNAVDPMARQMAIGAHARLDDHDAHNAATDDRLDGHDAQLSSLEDAADSAADGDAAADDRLTALEGAADDNPDEGSGGGPSDDGD
jgi:hypothetical protein